MASSGRSGGGFSLFPNTAAPRPPRLVIQPPPRPGPSAPSPSGLEHARQSNNLTARRDSNRSPGGRSPFVIDGTPSPLAGVSQQAEPAMTPPVPASLTSRTKSHAAATMPARNDSNRSRGSIAKRAVEGPTPPGVKAPAAAEAGLRSIFPQYDHSRPFNQQEYYPTQTSPRHIPRTVISRMSSVASPPSLVSTAPLWPRRQTESFVLPPVSTTEELREYWKAANGWKATSSEGRKYCMKLERERDSPVYTLSSATRPFYHLRINPTSASAYITLSRHDPSKPFKERDPYTDTRAGILAALRESDRNQTWHEAINTTVEEPSRRLPPEDGLVALLYPCAAMRMALNKPADIHVVGAAERECARLVWDEDSRNYFLVHPAVASPFRITIERNPAWSRTEYTVEHIESPQHIAKLTRHATGDGCIELDTLVAGRFDSFYILDVAVCALLIVASLVEKSSQAGTFEPPPGLPSPAHLRVESRTSSILSSLAGKKSAAKTRAKTRLANFEQLEMDLESQTSSLGKLHVNNKDKLPGPVRALIRLLASLFKLMIWVSTIIFRALMAVVVGLSNCVSSENR